MAERKRQRGIALITALLVLAIATIAAVEIANRQHLDIRRTQNTLARDQAQDYLLSAEAFLINALKRDINEGGTNQSDHLREDWAQPMVVPEFHGAKLTGQPTDLQGRFNLNNLSSLIGTAPDTWRQKAVYQQFWLLLENLKLSPEGQELNLQYDSHALIEALVDWIDPDVNPSGSGGAEDSYYLNLDPPYRPANDLLTHPSELQLIRGFGPEGPPGLVKLLVEDKRLVTALPTTAGTTTINVNTAPAEVLMAVIPGLSADNAVALAERAAEEPWSDVSAFVQEAQKLRGSGGAGQGASGIGGGNQIAAESLGVSSSYFALVARVELGPAVAYLESVIYRDPQTAALYVLSRSRTPF